MRGEAAETRSAGNSVRHPSACWDRGKMTPGVQPCAAKSHDEDEEDEDDDEQFQSKGALTVH